jgi:hypothetical protein
MPKEKMIEGEFKEEPKEQPKPAPETKPVQPSKPASEVFKEALKQVGEFGQTIGGAISTRDNVVMVRVNGDTLHKLDMLVDAEICKSRSEAAAYLINEGIKANAGLYSKIGEVTEQIAALREQLRVNILAEVKKEK